MARKKKKLYVFTFPFVHGSGHGDEETITLCYLAGSDVEFVKNCIGWALGCEEPNRPRQSVANAPEEWVQYHDDAATYHQALMEALDKKEVQIELNEGIGTWAVKDVSDEEIALLLRLGVINDSPS